MPPYLVTLAFADDAAGLHEEARQAAARAIRSYQRVSAILDPVLGSPAYGEAARAWREFVQQLDGVAYPR
jgi:hypothetical protein